MSITTDFDDLFSTKEQVELAIQYAKNFKIISTQMIRLNDELQTITADVKFDQLPTDVKQVLNQFWQLIQQFNAAVAANADIQEMLNYNN